MVRKRDTGSIASSPVRDPHLDIHVGVVHRLRVDIERHVLGVDLELVLASRVAVCLGRG